MTDFAVLAIDTDTTGVARGRREMRNLGDEGDRTESRVGGAMSKVGASWTRMASIAGAALGSIGIGAFFSASIREAEQFETTMFRIEAVIRATGGVAGRSAVQLRAQARELALGTLESTEGVLRAQQTLLTFRGVQGDVYDRAIEAAADMSAALGGDLNSAAMQLGRALEDPTQGVTALTRSGTVFTDSQREMIAALVDAGNTAEAQRFILSELEAQYGGTAVAAAQGLAGAQDTLSQRMQELRLEVAESLGLTTASTAAYNLMAGAVESLTGFVDSARGYFIAAALGLSAYYTPALVAATFQTGLFVASLITVRGALIATGIGAFIVAAGFAINFLLELSEKTGSWAEALTLLGVVSSGVWAGIVQSAGAIPVGLQVVWNHVSANFQSMLAGLAGLWSDFLSTLTIDLGEISFRGRTLVDFGEVAGFESLRASADAFSDRMSGGAIRATSDALIAQNEAAQIATAGLDSARAALTLLQDAMSDSETETTDTTTAITAINDALATTPTAAAAAGGALREVADAAAETQITLQSVGEDLAGVFADALTQAKSLTEGLRDLLKSLANTLLNRAFTQMFNSIMPSLNLSGARAMGGPVGGGQSYLVGERGPEIFTPGSSGGITPNHAIGGGGQTVNVINNSGQEARQTSRTGPDGQQILDIEIGRSLSRGRQDGAMARYNAKPAGVRR